VHVTVNGGKCTPKGWSRDRSSRSTIDIYVDPRMIGHWRDRRVKKKKSRAGWRGYVGWDECRYEGVPREDGER